MNFLSEPPNIWDHAIDEMMIGSTLLGIMWMYQINTKGDGQNFIARYICLSFPIGVKSLLLVFVLLIGLFTLAEFIEQMEIPEEETSVHIFILLVLVIAYFYLRLAYAMRIASGAKKEDTSP